MEAFIRFGRKIRTSAWNGGMASPKQARAQLVMAASAMPAAARHAYLLAEAYNGAIGEGESWSA